MIFGFAFCWMNTARYMHSNKFVLLKAPFHHLRSEEKVNVIFSFLWKDNSSANTELPKTSRKFNTYTNFTLFFT